MKCPKCQRDNPEGASFCNGCAHDLNSATETHSDRLVHLSVADMT